MDQFTSKIKTLLNKSKSKYREFVDNPPDAIKQVRDSYNNVMNKPVRNIPYISQIHQSCFFISHLRRAGQSRKYRAGAAGVGRSAAHQGENARLTTVVGTRVRMGLSSCLFDVPSLLPSSRSHCGRTRNADPLHSTAAA